MAGCNIDETDHVNSILAACRADLVALARPHLIDPMWTLRAAAQQDYRKIHVPPPYLRGQAQLARNLQRAAEQEAALNACCASRAIMHSSLAAALVYVPPKPALLQVRGRSSPSTAATANPWMKA